MKIPIYSEEGKKVRAALQTLMTYSYYHASSWDERHERQDKIRELSDFLLDDRAEYETLT